MGAANFIKKGLLGKAMAENESPSCIDLALKDADEVIIALRMFPSAEAALTAIANALDNKSDERALEVAQASVWGYFEAKEKVMSEKAGARNDQ